MERKKQHHKMASTAGQAPASNDLQSKEEEDRANATVAEKTAVTGGPSQDQQNLATPQFSANQWPQFPHLPLNPTGLEVQQGLPPPHFSQFLRPFWLLQHPGYQISRMPVGPLGTIESSFHFPAMMTNEKDHPQIPDFCYQANYPYPGFSGPWDPSFCLAQVPHLLAPHAYNYAEQHGYLSSQSSAFPNCSLSLGQCFQRGVIKPQAKVSQKHQQLWEAQSAENVQLWTVISQLQSEVASNKNQMVKLEAEVLSLKQTVEKTSMHALRTALSGRAPKRGQPKRVIGSSDALASPDESRPRARGRKLAQCKVHTEVRASIFDKVSLYKREKVEPQNSLHATQPNGSHMIPNNNGNVNVIMSSLQNQVREEMSEMQTCGMGLNSAPDMETNDGKGEDLHGALDVLSQLPSTDANKSPLASSVGGRNNGILVWPSSIACEDSAKDTSSAGFYPNGSVIRQGGKAIPGWSFVNEEDTSVEIGDVVVASGNDEIIGNNVKFGGEEIAGAQGEGLPQYTNW